ncbi:recombinase family protein [Actinophytocola algeriensis]|uniref:recombinase family protein n=1 Tax=Actinophytocola algeriensis TaxID=1768010 RepID=UPI001C8690D5|nr:recombinase family protein [Actinophytocola algeriensis]
MGTRKNVSAGQATSVPVFDSYARLSKNPNTGEFEKIETQWADNRRVIERLGGTLGQELDDGLSAWKKNVRRPGWAKLLERVASGASDGIVVWHTDRLFRQPRDLEKLIDLADKGFVVVSAHGSRDLADPDDRFILRIEVAHAARSSDDTSRRIKRRFRTFRENGMGHIGGPRRFGWPGRDLTWTPGEGETDDDRPMVPDALVARERRALAEATDAALSGISEAVIAREWNDQGLFTAEGRRWVRLTVKSVLSRPTNAGLVESDGELVATMPGEPIVDPRKFDLLRSKYAARRKGRVAGEVGPGYVGTGIIRCGEPGCGARLTARNGDGFYRDLTWTPQLARPLQAALEMTDAAFAEHLGTTVRTVTSWDQPDTTIDDTAIRASLETAAQQASISVKKRFAQSANTPVRKKYYTCEKERRGCGKVNADLRSVDQELRTYVILRLSDDRYAAAVEAARAQVADRLSAINADIAEYEQLQEAVSERLGRREFKTMAAFDKANKPIVEALDRLYTEREALSEGSPEGPTKAQPAAAIAAQWDAADNSERRSMLTKALGGSTLYLDRYVKRPGPRVFDRNRLRLVYPDGTTVTFGDLT